MNQLFSTWLANRMRANRILANLLRLQMRAASAVRRVAVVYARRAVFVS